jgi:hypothetical protein
MTTERDESAITTKHPSTENMVTIRIASELQEGISARDFMIRLKAADNEVNRAPPQKIGPSDLQVLGRLFIKTLLAAGLVAVIGIGFWIIALTTS